MGDFLVISGFSLWPKGPLAQIQTEAQKWKGLSYPEAGLQHELDVGKFDEVCISDKIWRDILARAGPPVPGEWPAIAGFAEADLSGIHVWDLSGPVLVGEEAEGEDEVVYMTEAKRGDVADAALREWAKAFIW